MKTYELKGLALDWAVGMAQGNPLRTEKSDWMGGVYLTPVIPTYDKEGDLAWFGSPSTMWFYGGPIIEREKMRVWFEKECPWYAFPAVPAWGASREDGSYREGGPTLLIAAMRCFVSSKLGEEIEVPEELS